MFTIRFAKEHQSKVWNVYQDILDMLKISRFVVLDLGYGERKITLGKIRLKHPKDYCGNHPSPCPVRPYQAEKPHKHMTYLEGADWVAFNDMLNDILDKHAVEANAGSSHVIIRKGLARCTEYAEYTLGNGIDKEWVKDSGVFKNCIGRKFVRAKYPEGTPGFASYLAKGTPKNYDEAKKELDHTVKAINREIDKASNDYVAAIQKLVNKHKIGLATGHLSDVWQVSKDGTNWFDEDDWKNEFGKPHPLFAELQTLDDSVVHLGIGPSNMERFRPQ